MSQKILMWSAFLTAAIVLGHTTGAIWREAEPACDMQGLFCGPAYLAGVVMSVVILIATPIYSFMEWMRHRSRVRGTKTSLRSR